jgi:hypothetical protein
MPKYVLKTDKICLKFYLNNLYLAVKVNIKIRFFVRNCRLNTAPSAQEYYGWYIIASKLGF